MRVLQFFENKAPGKEPVIRITHKEPTMLPEQEVFTHPIEILLYHQGKRDWRLMGILESLCDSRAFKGAGNPGLDSLPFEGSFKDYLTHNEDLKHNYHYMEATLRSTQIQFAHPGVYRVKLDIFLVSSNKEINVNEAYFGRFCNETCH